MVDCENEIGRRQPWRWGGLTAETKMNASIQNYLSSLRLGEPQTHRNIVVVPLIGSSFGTSRWLTLGEALEQQLLSVTEVNHGGSVPKLTVINRADRPALLLDGEELIGAKQNRVLNTTILLSQRSAAQLREGHTFQPRCSPTTFRMTSSTRLTN